LTNVHQLLAAAQRWDEAALTEIYDTFAPSIYRYIYRKTGSRETSQDLTSETFQRFLEALSRGGGPTKHLSGWLYRVAHNLVVDHYRRQPVDPIVSLDTVDPAVPPAQEPHLARQNRVVHARAALSQLTPLQQDVIILRFLEELSLQEVADVLNRTVGSIKSLQHRAVNSLQRVLEENDET
jgi:RNA polymerase sigma-70 factor (ECF subfamily)